MMLAQRRDQGKLGKPKRLVGRLQITKSILGEAPRPLTLGRSLPAAAHVATAGA